MPLKFINIKQFIAVLFLVVLFNHCSPSAASKTHLPRYISTDFEAALKTSKKKTKPLLVYFWNDNNTDCISFNKNILKNELVQSFIQEYYLIVALNTNDTTLLPKEEWIFSKELNCIIKTVGQQNFLLQKQHTFICCAPYLQFLGYVKGISIQSVYSSYYFLDLLYDALLSIKELEASAKKF